MGFSYVQLLVDTLTSLPVSISTPPRQCTCSLALLRSRNGASFSYHQEKNSLDELADQRAVGFFMAAHPPMNAHYQTNFMPAGGMWTQTQPYLAHQTQQPLAGRGVWVDLAPMGQGVCQQGDRGIAESNVAHYNAYQNSILAGNPTLFLNLYSGKNVHDVRRGEFSMPGTPRR